jgi:hypothetical protein
LKKQQKMKSFLHKSSMQHWGYCTMICLSIIGIQAKANAGTITLADQNLTDAMSITGQTGMTSGVTVSERYAESTRIPYSSLVRKRTPA